jgi:hypothetical protein
MDKVIGLQKNRKYEDYAGHPGCQGCKVQDFIVCPMVDRAYDKNITIKSCDVLRPFGEKIIRAIDRGGNPKMDRRKTG